MKAICGRYVDLKELMERAERPRKHARRLILRVAAVCSLVFLLGWTTGNVMPPLWGQRIHETMGYEDALELVQDSAAHPSMRMNALSRLHTITYEGYKALLDARSGNDHLKPHAENFVKHMDGLRTKYD